MGKGKQGKHTHLLEHSGFALNVVGQLSGELGTRLMEASAVLAVVLLGTRGLL